MFSIAEVIETKHRIEMPLTMLLTSTVDALKWSCDYFYSQLLY